MPEAAHPHPAAHGWHLATGLVSGVALLVQLVMIVRGINVLVDETGAPAVALGTRIVRFFSYFTVQSNLLVTVGALLLAADPRRDGPLFRVVRLAGLVGITVTFVVYLVALRPILHLEGLAAATDFGLHIATPALAVVGWALFGPWPRFTWTVLAWMLAWPVAWAAYTFVHGALSDWYPYPFIDVTAIGYGGALQGVLLVTVLVLAVGAVYVWRDGAIVRARSRRRVPG